MKIEIIQVKNNKFLFLDDVLWMWDIPAEYELQQEIANQGYGDVLVAGYGFGIMSKLLLKNPCVKSVMTVEKYPEIIQKNEEFDQIHGSIIIIDFYDLPELENAKFDCVVGDIWADIDRRSLNEYKKFKEKAQKLIKPNGLILGWGSDYFDYLIEKEKS